MSVVTCSENFLFRLYCLFRFKFIPLHTVASFVTYLMNDKCEKLL